MSEEVKETGVATKPTNMAIGKFGLQITNLIELDRFAKALLDSGYAPKDMNTVAKIVIAVQFGMEAGLSPMQGVNSVAVINNRPCLWGDAVPGLCVATGKVEVNKPEWIGEKGKDTWGCRYTVKRHGMDPHINEFTVETAKKASLWGKTGPWSQYPDRMLMQRARTFSFRDAFPEVLKGLPVAEEHMGHVEEIPVTIHEPDGTETKVKAKGMRAVKEKLAATTVEATTTTTPTTGDSTGMTAEQKKSIEDEEAAEAAKENAGELPLK